MELRNLTKPRQVMRRRDNPGEFQNRQPRLARDRGRNPISQSDRLQKEILIRVKWYWHLARVTIHDFQRWNKRPACASGHFLLEWHRHLACASGHHFRGRCHSYSGPVCTIRHILLPHLPHTEVRGAGLDHARMHKSFNLRTATVPVARIALLTRRGGCHRNTVLL